MIHISILLLIFDMLLALWLGYAIAAFIYKKRLRKIANTPKVRVLDALDALEKQVDSIIEELEKRKKNTK